MKTYPERLEFPAGKIAILGILTIAVYGAWHYSFGVLLDPIILDTGWNEAALAAGFGASGLIAGVGAIGGGWLLDRRGSRTVFALAAAVGLVAFLVATAANDVTVFVVSGAIGGGAFGALGFYHVTQTAAVRISPAESTKAIAVLTIWGAFSSVLYLPASAWLVDAVGWRDTLRLTALSGVVALLVASVAVDTAVASSESRHWGELRESLRVPEVKRFVVAQGMVGIGVGVILVYQVPAMTAAGLSLSAASFWAGVRGFSQLGGRLPLMPIVNRLGTIGALRLAFLSVALGSLILAFAGSPLPALLFAVLAGFGIGAASPLTGMYAQSLFGPATLGTAMGFLLFVFLVVGAIGPAAAGFLADATGSRAIPVALSGVLTGGAAFVVAADPKS